MTTHRGAWHWGVVPSPPPSLSAPSPGLFVDAVPFEFAVSEVGAMLMSGMSIAPMLVIPPMWWRRPSRALRLASMEIVYTAIEGRGG